jgi:hypothetical protein
MKCDRLGCSLKMFLLSELEALTKSLAAWKESDTPAGRSWWVLTMLGRRTDEKESGLWPTPNVPNGGRSIAYVTDWRGRTAYHNGKKVQVGLEAAVKMWPTPTVNGNHNRKGLSKHSGDGLATVVAKFPTPTGSMMTVGDMEQARYAGNDPRRPTYAEANRRWPTPTVNDSKNNGSPSQHERQTKALNVVAGGSLNPNFVEFLQGYPKDWTKVDE